MSAHSTDFPPPVIDIVINGVKQLGSYYQLTCNVVVIDRLINELSVMWFNSSDSVITNTVDLIFPSLQTSDAGEYTCQVILSISQVDLIVKNNISQPLYLQRKIFV